MGSPAAMGLVVGEPVSGSGVSDGLSLGVVEDEG